MCAIQPEKITFILNCYQIRHFGTLWLKSQSFSEALFHGKRAVIIQGVCFFFWPRFSYRIRGDVSNPNPLLYALTSFEKKNAGSGWSCVSDILGDNNWNLPGVGREKFSY